jgi:hypothetical protein
MHDANAHALHEHSASGSGSGSSLSQEKGMQGEGKTDAMLEDFEKAWSAYPDKTGKVNALKAYRKYRKDGDTQEDVLAGIARYRAYVAAKRQGGQDLHWRNGSTFFNQAAWRDEFKVDQMTPVTQSAQTHTTLHKNTPRQQEYVSGKLEPNPSAQ